MYKMLKWLIQGLIFSLVLTFGIVMMVKSWTTGGTESDYEIICLGGHQYYHANFTNKALLGIVLTDDGMPVNCNDNLEIK